jgi:hypothetical protein
VKLEAMAFALEGTPSILDGMTDIPEAVLTEAQRGIVGEEPPVGNAEGREEIANSFSAAWRGDYSGRLGK